jgi:hypothetical protein
MTTIPTSSHPTPTITKMLSHFTYLKDAGFNFPALVQAMIILCKLPPTMKVIAQILSQTAPSEIKNLKPDGIVKLAMLSFKQKGTSHGSGDKASQANKLSKVQAGRSQVCPAAAAGWIQWQWQQKHSCPRTRSQQPPWWQEGTHSP